MIKVQSKEIVMVSLEDIKLNPKNRNKHPKDQIDRLIDIIKYQGFRRPVSISNRSGFLSCGEGRFLAAQKLGMDKIPAIYQDYDSEEQEYADGIADNAIDKWAILDMSSINNDIGDLGPDFDIDILGINNFKIDYDPLDDALEKKDKDSKNFKFIICPHCNEKFEEGQAIVIKDGFKNVSED